MICGNCGKENDTNSTICVNCGGNLEQVPQPSNTNNPVNQQSNTSVNPFFNQENQQNNFAQPQITNTLQTSVASGGRNKKPKLKFIIPIIAAVVLMIITFGIYYMFFMGGTSADQIRPLSVDLEKYEFKCSDKVCDDLNSKILSIHSYAARIDNIYYDYIFITSDGNLYLVDDSKDGNILKIDTDIKINSIDSTTALPYLGDNASILAFLSDKKYYVVTKEGKLDDAKYNDNILKDIKLSDIVEKYNLKKILAEKSDSIYALDSNSKIVYLTPCAKAKSKNPDLSHCKSKPDDYLLVFKPNKDMHYAKTVKNSSKDMFLTDDNNYYLLASTFMNINPQELSLDYMYKNLPSNSEALQQNAISMWEIDNGSVGYSTPYDFVQTDDNALYLYKIGILNLDYDVKYSLDERVENIFCHNRLYFLLTTKSKVYMPSDEDIDKTTKTGRLKEVPELNKYKNNIRATFNIGRKHYVLLSDGNLYKYLDFDTR